MSASRTTSQPVSVAQVVSSTLVPGLVATGDRDGLARAEPKAPGAAVEHRPEDARRVEARHAQPLDRAVGSDQGTGVAVREHRRSRRSRGNPGALRVAGSTIGRDSNHPAMRIAVAADERAGIADDGARASCAGAATSRSPTGRCAEGERDDWAWASEAAARDVAEGRAEQAIVCCWTGTGASIAANKVAGHPGGAVRRRRRPRTAPGAGTTPTCWRSACARPRRRSWPRSSTPGSAASRRPSATTAPTSTISPRSSPARARDRPRVERAAARRAETTVADQVATLDLVSLAPRGSPVRDHQLRAHPRRSRDDLRPLGADRLRDRHRDAGRPAHPRRRGDDRRRDDARRALRARDRRPGQARAPRARGPAGTTR